LSFFDIFSNLDKFPFTSAAVGITAATILLTPITTPITIPVPPPEPAPIPAPEWWDSEEENDF